MKKAAAIKRFLLALFLLLVLGFVVVIFGPSDRGSIGHTVTFSDGTTMTLKAVTYGTQHQYFGANGGWQQRLLSLLPDKLAAKLATRRATMVTGRPSVALWFERVGWPTNGEPQLVLFDTTGFGVSGSLSGMMQARTTTNVVEGWAFDCWPRRERTFTLRIYEQGKKSPDGNLLGEFTVRNPMRGQFPIWSAPEPPATASNGDLSVTLFDLTAGVGRRSGRWKPAASPTLSQTRVGFRVERNGRPTKEWEIIDFQASDATSNVVAGIWGRSPESDAECIQLQPHLWPAEQAWKLRVGFTQRSNFAASELWTLRGVPLSETDLTNIGTQTNLQGALLQFTGQELRPRSVGRYHHNFRVTPARADYRLTLVRAVDDNGVEATVNGSFEDAGEWGFPLRGNARTTSFDVTVALHQTRYFEFLVRPRIISTNESSPR